MQACGEINSPSRDSYVYEGFSGSPEPMRRIYPPIEEEHRFESASPQAQSSDKIDT